MIESAGHGKEVASQQEDLTLFILLQEVREVVERLNRFPRKERGKGKNPWQQGGMVGKRQASGGGKVPRCRRY